MLNQSRCNASGVRKVVMKSENEIIKNLKSKLDEMNIDSYNYTFFGLEKVDCFNIHRHQNSWNTFYSVYYVDDRGKREYEMYFDSLQNAADYLIRLFETPLYE